MRRCVLFGIGLVLATFTTGCAAWRKQAVTSAKQCAQQEFEQAITDLLPAVAGILTGGAANWKTQLEALAEKFGVDFVSCTVAKIANATFDAAAVASTPRPAMSAAMMDAAQSRARSYLSEKKVAL